MDSLQAAKNLEVIRTLMERTCRYQLLTARAGVLAGSLAAAGALLFFAFDASDPWAFGLVWGMVFLGATLATVLTAVARGRERGEKAWSRQARAVVMALAPSVFAALVLSAGFFAWGMHLWLPGVWMLCYGQGALATSTYAPTPIRWFGIAVLLGALPTFWLGPSWASVAMGIVFGLGHIGLGASLLVLERRQSALQLRRFVA
jgi:hypothetical protein